MSEFTGRSPVYRDLNGNILKNSNDAYSDAIDDAIQTNSNGFRLPTADEWNMAARWTNYSSSSLNGEVYLDGRYWKPDNYVSGGEEPIEKVSTYTDYARGYILMGLIMLERKTPIILPI